MDVGDKQVWNMNDAARKEELEAKEYNRSYQD